MEQACESAKLPSAAVKNQSAAEKTSVLPYLKIGTGSGIPAN